MNDSHFEWISSRGPAMITAVLADYQPTAYA